MDKVLKLENGQYDLIETVSYPNGGASYFYVRDQQQCHLVKLFTN